MNRHTRRNILIWLQRSAMRAPTFAVVDFIVGFPGETDADFDATMDLVAAVFTHKPFRSNTAAPGTPAAASRLTKILKPVVCPASGAPQ